MKAYLLAAGYATRMYPLTRDTPKALLEVGDSPILTHIVRRVSALDDLTDIVVVTNDRFAAHFQAWSTAQTTPAPITVLNDGTTSDANRLGAIADLAFALEQVPLGREDAVVAATDNLFDFDLRALQHTFQSHGRPMLVVRRVEDHTHTSRYNEVALEPDGRVARFREKPEQAETDLTAIALYFFPATTLELIGHYLETGQPDAPGHFISWLVDRVPCYAEPMPGPWYDVGSTESLERARAQFRR